MKFKFDKWQLIRDRGKSNYIYRKTISGFVLGIAVPTFLILFMRLWIGKDFFEKTGSLQISIAYVSALVGFTLLFLLCAVFDWGEYEKQFTVELEQRKLQKEKELEEFNMAENEQE